MMPFNNRVGKGQHDEPGSAVYVGFDPTADSLHVGNLIAIMALLHFRQAGYQPIAVVRSTYICRLYNHLDFVGTVSIQKPINCICPES